MGHREWCRWSLLPALGLLALLGACGSPPPPAEPSKPAASAPSETTPTAAVPASPEQGGPRNWQVPGSSAPLSLRESASAGSKLLATYEAETILDNLGCQPGDAGVWCDVQQLGGGPRGFVPAGSLKPAVSPDGSVARGSDDSALRAGQGDFDARGSVPCAQQPGQPMGSCPFAVARAGGGYATVLITRPEGGTRAIYFRMGRAIGADSSEADASGPFTLKREADLNLIRVGKERYEIPDAVVLGG